VRSGGAGGAVVGLARAGCARARSRAPGGARGTRIRSIDYGGAVKLIAAAVLAVTLNAPALAGVTFEVVAGDTPIEQALAACRSTPAG
jgi:hypothetical protein